MDYRLLEIVTAAYTEGASKNFTKDIENLVNDTENVHTQLMYVNYL